MTLNFRRNFFFTLFLGSLLFVLTPNVSQAIDCGDGFKSVGGTCIVINQGGGTGIASATDAQSVITTVIKYLLFFAGAIAVLFIIIGGFRYMTAGANAEGAKKARLSLVNAVIGLVVVILSYAIVLVINNLLNK